MLFVAALGATWVASSLLAGLDFGLIDPRTSAALQINNQFTVRALAAFVVWATQAFVTFPPLGMVLVMVIGVAVAERSGLVGGALRGGLSVASPRLLTTLVAVAALADSNIGALIALLGAETLRALAMPPVVTIVGIVLLTAAIDFLVPSASAKWALVAPILVPMLMSVGLAPELTQAAFRVGDGPVNIMTPLMPYFPLVLAFCRRYVTGFQVGTLMSLLLPFGVTYLALQVAMLLLWWLFGLSLGIGGRYVYP